MIKISKIRENKKRGQITIFIIVALVLVAAVLLFFMLYRKPTIVTVEEYEPSSYIDKCTRDATEEALNLLLMQGGYLSPQNYKLYENNRVGYLCYTRKYYTACTNQEPMYLEHLKSEIKLYIEPKISQCFLSLKTELKKRNYNVQEGSQEVKVELLPKTVEINIEKKFVIEKHGDKREFNNFKTRINNPIYDLALIAQEIANQEAKFCNFEYIGYMALYPEYKIEKTRQGDESIKIYIIEEKTSGKKLNIAIRSCVIKAGF